MATQPDVKLPSAKDYMQKIALAEAEEASKEAAAAPVVDVPGKTGDGVESIKH